MQKRLYKALGEAQMARRSSRNNPPSLRTASTLLWLANMIANICSLICSALSRRPSAQITYQGKHINLGYFATKEEAAEAYNAAAQFPR
jgi:hypothetical protein